MADFMEEHSNLAKNLLPNCGQGKAVSNRLWETLTLKLNSAGPPLKDSKLWRKVYTDQKFNVKRKISFNKASKRKTGGGPFEEISLSSTEEQIMQAAGIDVAVEGLSSVTSFGTAKTPKQSGTDSLEKSLQEILGDDEEESEQNQGTEEKENEGDVETDIFKGNKRPTNAETKINLLKSNLKKIEESKLDISTKLDRLLELKERSLKMKVEKHVAKMAILKLDHQIKSMELEMLKKRNEMLNPF